MCCVVSCVCVYILVDSNFIVVVLVVVGDAFVVGRVIVLVAVRVIVLVSVSDIFRVLAIGSVIVVVRFELQCCFLVLIMFVRYIYVVIVEVFAIVMVRVGGDVFVVGIVVVPLVGRVIVLAFVFRHVIVLGTVIVIVLRMCYCSCSCC